MIDRSILSGAVGDLAQVPSTVAAGHVTGQPVAMNVSGLSSILDSQDSISNVIPRD